MNIYNRIFATALMGAVAFLAVLLGGVLTVLTPAQAQDLGVNESLSCPLDSALEIWFMTNQTELEVDDELLLSVSLANNSAYTMGGMQIGVALYNRANQLQYWMILDEKPQQLSPQTISELPVTINLSAVPAGVYKIVPYVMQGDETALLGKILNDAHEIKQPLIIKKKTAQKNIATVSVSVNEISYTGTTIKFEEATTIGVSIFTKNESPVPLLESNMLAVITQGSVPLGTAVEKTK